MTRSLLLDPSRWWRQTDLVETTGLDDGHLSRVVRRLEEDRLLVREGTRFRPRDPGVLLDAWADVYRFDRHDVLAGHMSGSGVELATELRRRLTSGGLKHAFTGLTAAWAMNQHARFRLVSAYVHGDPRAAASAIGVRPETKGANVQIIGPDDVGIFEGTETRAGFACVSPVQVYLDLLHLPERAKDAAAQLRADQLLWGVHG